eukprot:gene2739-1724_t
MDAWFVFYFVGRSGFCCLWVGAVDLPLLYCLRVPMRSLWFFSLICVAFQVVLACMRLFGIRLRNSFADMCLIAYVEVGLLSRMALIFGRFMVSFSLCCVKVVENVIWHCFSDLICLDCAIYLDAGICGCCYDWNWMMHLNVPGLHSCCYVFLDFSSCAGIGFTTGGCSYEEFGVVVIKRAAAFAFYAPLFECKFLLRFTCLMLPVFGSSVIEFGLQLIQLFSNLVVDFCGYLVVGDVASFELCLEVFRLWHTFKVICAVMVGCAVTVLMVRVMLFWADYGRCLGFVVFVPRFLGFRDFGFAVTLDLCCSLRSCCCWIVIVMSVDTQGFWELFGEQNCAFCTVYGTQTVYETEFKGDRVGYSSVLVFGFRCIMWVLFAYGCGLVLLHSGVHFWGGFLCTLCPTGMSASDNFDYNLVVVNYCKVFIVMFAMSAGGGFWEFDSFGWDLRVCVLYFSKPLMVFEFRVSALGKFAIYDLVGFWACVLAVVAERRPLSCRLVILVGITYLPRILCSCEDFRLFRDCYLCLFNVLFLWQAAGWALTLAMLPRWVASAGCCGFRCFITDLWYWICFNWCNAAGFYGRCCLQSGLVLWQVVVWVLYFGCGLQVVVLVLGLRFVFAGIVRRYCVCSICCPRPVLGGSFVLVYLVVGADSWVVIVVGFLRGIACGEWSGGICGKSVDAGFWWVLGCEFMAGLAGCHCLCGADMPWVCCDSEGAVVCGIERCLLSVHGVPQQGVAAIFAGFVYFMQAAASGCGSFLLLEDGFGRIRCMFWLLAVMGFAMGLARGGGRQVLGGSFVLVYLVVGADSWVVIVVGFLWVLLVVSGQVIFAARVWMPTCVGFLDARLWRVWQAVTKGVCWVFMGCHGRGVLAVGVGWCSCQQGVITIFAGVVGALIYCFSEFVYFMQAAADGCGSVLMLEDGFECIRCMFGCWLLWDFAMGLMHVSDGLLRIIACVGFMIGFMTNRALFCECVGYGVTTTLDGLCLKGCFKFNSMVVLVNMGVRACIRIVQHGCCGV